MITGTVKMKPKNTGEESGFANNRPGIKDSRGKLNNFQCCPTLLKHLLLIIGYAPCITHYHVESCEYEAWKTNYRANLGR